MATRLDSPTIPLRYPGDRLAGAGVDVLPRPYIVPPVATMPVVIIQASGWWPGLRLRELWAYRTLLRFLVWRDLKVKYAQTVLGAGWAILQPALTMLVFTVVFGIFAGLPSDGVPFSVFALAALVPWL
jgi:lipopolysaccharide transport system permease protein